MKKLLSFALLFLLSLVALTPHAYADEDDADHLLDELPEEYAALLDALPKELLERLPDGLYSSSPTEVGVAVGEMTDFSFLLSTLLELLGAELGPTVALMGSLIGILLLSAIVNALRNSLGGEEIKGAFSLCSALVLCSLLLTKGYGMLEECVTFFSSLNSLCAAMLPLVCVLYTLGGNLGAGAASATGLSIYMTLLEELVGKSILPFCTLCTVMALITSLCPQIRLGTLLSTVKKNYTTLLSFLMMLLLAVLSTQTLLSAGSDTLAMRSARFAAGSILPVVGGSIGELLRTVSAGVGYLRSTLGVCAVILVLLTLLPTLVRLFLFRLVWQIGASLAELLGCVTEKKLLDEFASLCGYLLSAVSICSSVLLLSLTALVRCTSAIG